MIEEKYLKMAISIRRTYLKLINNLDLYHNRALKVSSNLEETLAKLDTIQEGLDLKDKKPSSKETLDKILDILQEVEDEGKKLEIDTLPPGDKLTGTPYIGENDYQSCYGRAAQAINWLNPLPKCWQCELVRGESTLVKKDHWWVECIAYDTDGAISDRINFDLHADFHGKGNLQNQRTEYPINLPVGDADFLRNNPRLTRCGNK